MVQGDFLETVADVVAPGSAPLVAQYEEQAGIKQLVADVQTSIKGAFTLDDGAKAQLGEGIAEHWPLIVAMAAGIFAAQATVALLAAIPHPAAQIAALLIEAVLLALAAYGAVTAGSEVIEHAGRWWSRVRSAHGDPRALREASLEFARLLISVVLLVLAALDLRAMFRIRPTVETGGGGGRTLLDGEPTRPPSAPTPVEAPPRTAAPKPAAEAPRTAAPKPAAEAPRPAAEPTKPAAPPRTKTSGAESPGTPGDREASVRARAAHEAKTPPRSPLTPQQQAAMQELLRQHPGLHPDVAADAVRGAESATAGAGGDVFLINGGRREITVYRGAFDERSLGSHLEAKAAREGVTQVYMQIATPGASQEGFLRILSQLRGGTRAQLDGIYIKIFGPDGSIWWNPDTTW